MITNTVETAHLLAKLRMNADLASGDWSAKQATALSAGVPSSSAAACHAWAQADLAWQMKVAAAYAADLAARIIFCP